MPQAFTRYAIITMVLIGFLASVYACGRATDATTGTTKLEKLSIGAMEGMDFAFKGDAAPDDVFIGPRGKEVSLADFRGDVVVLNVWATWCGPCEEEMPSLAALQRSRGGEEFVVLALSIDDIADRDFAQGELKRWSGGELELYQSEDLSITQSLGVVGFPTTIIYASDGTEIARYLGDTDWAGYEAIGFMDAIIGRK